ncbi:unnamed protein product [Leptosia nina]|uniref:Uncharacterized protein n=1 Tax=Leptosia nina TaxID=320188 RepID=A0AAV1J9W2_9NEOP
MDGRNATYEMTFRIFLLDYIPDQCFAKRPIDEFIERPNYFEAKIFKRIGGITFYLAKASELRPTILEVELSLMSNEHSCDNLSFLAWIVDTSYFQGAASRAHLFVFHYIKQSCPHLLYLEARADHLAGDRSLVCFFDCLRHGCVSRTARASRTEFAAVLKSARLFLVFSHHSVWCSRDLGCKTQIDRRRYPNFDEATRTLNS